MTTVVPSLGDSGILKITLSGPAAKGVNPALNCKLTGLLALIVPVVVIVLPVENEIPVPAVRVVTLPAPPPPPPGCTQIKFPDVSDCKYEAPVPGKFVGKV